MEVFTNKPQAFCNYCQDIIENHLSLSTNNLGIQVNPEDVSKLVIILAASRSGSSILFELLRNSEHLLSLSGEHTPYYKIHGYSFPFKSFQSDLIDLTQIGVLQNLNSLARDLILDFRVGAEGENFDFEEYAHSLTVRLAMQWPQFFLPYEAWIEYV